MAVDCALIEAVITAEANAKAAEARVTAAREVFNMTNALLLKDQEQAREAQDAAEDKLREAALAEYAITKSKQPGPGLVIRLIPTFVYDPAKALAWAKDRRMAVSLDVKAFKKLAGAKADGTEEFVTITQIPQATIASDLTAALAKEEVGA